ncbi:hypothetical protein K438DRAFT_1755979 [Mycena galopus ATCC 62051]|nr:hypothetical protein K438DRAFT_1755979 [Mycena galopus ATCC 62051]
MAPQVLHNLLQVGSQIPVLFSRIPPTTIFPLIPFGRDLLHHHQAKVTPDLRIFSSTPSSEFDWPSHSHTSHSRPTSEFAILEEMTSPALYPSPPADWDPSLASMLSAFEAAPPDFLGSPPQNPLDDYFALLDSSLPLPDPGLSALLEALHYHLFQLAGPDPTLSIESNPPQFSEPQDLNSGVTVESGAMESASVRVPLSPRRSARKRAASTVHSDAPPSKIISAESAGVPVIAADSGRRTRRKPKPWESSMTIKHTSFEFLAQFPDEYRSLYGDAETA